jgi:hypothetical protein
VPQQSGYSTLIAHSDTLPSLSGEWLNALRERGSKIRGDAKVALLEEIFRILNAQDEGLSDEGDLVIEPDRFMNRALFRSIQFVHL